MEDFNDDDWVLADVDDLHSGISGLVFPSPSGRVAFAPFSSPSSVGEPYLSFLPSSLSLTAASNGLLLFRSAWSSYSVCNPSTKDLFTLPPPPISHHRTAAAAAAIVAAPPHRNPSAHYHVVVPVTVAGALRFDIYSSSSNKWYPSPQAIHEATPILPFSGVSADASACWRTAGGKIVRFKPETGEAGILEPPEEIGAGEVWQIGEAEGYLGCVVVRATAVDLYSYGAFDMWELQGSIAIKRGSELGEKVTGETMACVAPPWPLRFQSADPEAVMWVDGNVFAVDVERRRARKARIPPACGLNLEEYVSHIRTDASPQPKREKPAAGGR